jgi:integrase
MATITKSAVERLGPHEVRWDSRISGFGVRRQKGGRPVYVLKYRAGRGRKARQRWFTIGRHGSPWTPDTARAEARRLLGLAAAGKDPAGDRYSRLRAGTMEQLAADFQAAHLKIWRISTVKTNARLIARTIVPTLGRLRPEDVKHTDVAGWHARLSETPGAANRALAVLSSMLGWAIKNGLREAPNPCRDIKRFRGRKVERFLSTVELNRLSEALRAVEKRDPYIVAAIRLLIFTGARLGEILGLRWDWIDFERSLINLPDSKTGAKSIYLSAPALEVLTKLPRVAGNPHVIVGREAGSALVNLQKPWRRIRKSAELQEVRIHDLRHSFASIGASMGEGLPIIGRLLGHRHTATTARYSHLAADPLRAANEKIGARIVAAMAGNKPALVLPLNPKRAG